MSWVENGTTSVVIPGTWPTVSLIQSVSSSASPAIAAQTSLELTLTTRSPVIARPTVAPTPVTPKKPQRVANFGGPLSHRRSRNVRAPCSFTTTFRSWKVGVRAVLRNGRIATAMRRRRRQPARLDEGSGRTLASRCGSVHRATPQARMVSQLWLPASEQEAVQRRTHRHADYQGGHDGRGVPQPWG